LTIASQIDFMHVQMKMKIFNTIIIQ